MRLSLAIAQALKGVYLDQDMLRTGCVSCLQEGWCLKGPQDLQVVDSDTLELTDKLRHAS